MRFEGYFFQAFGSKTQEKSKGISVSGDGLRACPALLQETLREESLNELREVGVSGHGSASLLFSSLRVANSSNSGTASMYQ